MSIIPDTIPISELRQDAANIIKRMKSASRPVIITQRGRASAVIVSAEAYQRDQHELEILKMLARGEVEIEAGTGNDLETVFAKADELLAAAK